MSDRRPKLLFDAIAATAAARSFVSGVTLADYEADLLRRSATERQFETLGEACARPAREDAARCALIPAAWTAVGMRDRIIHGYDAVDNETVYRTVLDDLPALEAALRAWLGELDDAS